MYSLNITVKNKCLQVHDKASSESVLAESTQTTQVVFITAQGTRSHSPSVCSPGQAQPPRSQLLFILFFPSICTLPEVTVSEQPTSEMCPKPVIYSHAEVLYPCSPPAKTKSDSLAIDTALTTFVAFTCSKRKALGLPYCPQCIHEILTQLGKSFYRDMAQLIIALQRGRVLFHIHLAPAGCVL